MAVLELRPSLTEEERIEKRKLIVSDLISLLSLLLVTVVLAILTYFLFNSFTVHRQDLANRWRARGDAAMANGHPEQAVTALRSALEYDHDHQIAISLATALAAAGHTQEAEAYFKSLLEAEPGNGFINLQLARLAVKQGKAADALEDYQRALDGTWHGDGYKRRLSVRLELARYQLNRHDETGARTQLLIAAGNAPDDVAIKLQIASMLEEAQDPLSALEMYGALAQRKPVPIDALEGAGRTAFALGRFVQARGYLERAVDHAGFEAQPESLRTTYRGMLADTQRLLALYPAPELKVMERAKRILEAANIARQRLNTCMANTTTPIASLADLSAQWQQVPPNTTPMALARDPQMEQTTMGLVYDTEKETAAACGSPTGDDALLLKLALVSQAVEQQ